MGQAPLWKLKGPGAGRFIMLAIWCGLLQSGPLQGGELPGDPAYTRKGADSCLRCHDEDAAFPVLPIFATKHGRVANERSPMASLQCESCHGPGGDHAVRVHEGESREAMPAFGSRATEDVATQNQRCLGCHQTHRQREWPESPHADAGLRCSDCHSIHTPQDRVLDSREQAELCYGCHVGVRSASMQRSAHPLRQGQLICSDCHDTHGSNISDGLLIRENLRQTCLDCHAEKRGPFLWEHAPAAEDCALCHRPHGSNHAALLTQAKPLLCQQCHAQAGHPSTPFTSGGLPDGSPSGFLLNSSCSNCHSQVHGSNHPAGSGLMR